jgi:hypothetical protein
MTDETDTVIATATGSAPAAPTPKEEAINDENALKRPAASNDDDDDSSDDEGVDSSKRAKTETEGAPLDLAVTLGYKKGDRIQVQWEIEKKGQIGVHWWGASLLEHDGRTTDQVAIRTIKYDAYPELGFHSCTDDVIFLGDDLIVSPDSQTQLKYRREGEEEIFSYNEGDMDEQLNAILMGALDKNKNAWASLNPATQAIIAEKIALKKDKLMEVLRAHNDVITSATIKDILQKAFE